MPDDAGMWTIGRIVNSVFSHYVILNAGNEYKLVRLEWFHGLCFHSSLLHIIPARFRRDGGAIADLDAARLFNVQFKQTITLHHATFVVTLTVAFFLSQSTCRIFSDHSAILVEATIG